MNEWMNEWIKGGKLKGGAKCRFKQETGSGRTEGELLLKKKTDCKTKTKDHKRKWVWGPKTKVATKQQDKVKTKAKTKHNQKQSSNQKCIKEIKIQNMPGDTRGGEAGNLDEGHHRDRTRNRSNEQTKTRGKAET